MSSIEEKRVYGERSGRTTLYVASEAGLLSVAVSGDRVGEFGVVRRYVARDVAARGVADLDDTAGGGERSGPDVRLAVATEEAVLAGPPGDLSPAGFGAATAVGFDGDDLLAAGPRGRVARLERGAWTANGSGEGATVEGTEDEEARTEAADRPEPDEGAWTTLGTVGEVRALDGGLVAAADGVHRVRGDVLDAAGLDDVRDVAAAGVPHAATAAGLYRLGNGWLEELAGDFRMVAAGPETVETGPTAPRAHAATADAAWALADGEWTRVDLPVAEPLAGVGYGAGVYAATTAGTVLVDAGDGWRTRSLGVGGVRAVAVVGRTGVMNA